jgi:hypothetical protein
MRPQNYQSGYDIKELISKIATPKTKPITIGPPILGVNYRLKRSEIDMKESPYCKNARITRNYIEPRPGLTLISSAFDSTIMYIREFITSEGTNYLLILTTKSLYYSIDLTTFTRRPWYYSTGTVTTAVASAVVTGLGTTWATNARAGDRFRVTGDEDWATIESVDSNTQLTLTDDYGAIHAGATYQIDRYFGGDEDNAFWGVTIADVDYFCFSQGIDPVLYVDTNMDEVKRLSSDCGAAGFGILFADRLIIANLTNLPFRLQYSVRGGYTDWTGVGSGFKDWVEDPQEITGLSVFSGILLVYKSYSIGTMVETGRSDSPFEYKNKIPGIGLYYPGIFFSVGDSDVIGGSDNFYSYNAVNVKALGDDVKDRFLKVIDPNYSYTAHSLVIEEFGEAQIFYPTADNTTPNKCWVYNYEMDIWSGEWDLAATASGYATQEVGESWNSAVGSWDTDTDIWDSAQMLASVPLNLVANGTSLYKEDANALSDEGVDFTFEWQLKEITASDFEEGVEAKTISAFRVVVAYYCAVTSTLKCSLSGDAGESFTDEMSVDLDINNPSRLKYAFFDFIETFETLTVRFRCTNGGRFQIVKVRIEAITSGEVIPS